jgi:uncharacterized ferredoxin-like protein
MKLLWEESMAIKTSDECEREAVEAGASMMALAARTAPKSRGLDSVIKGKNPFFDRPAV